MSRDRALNRFLHRVLEDRLSGEVQSLETYQGLFPDDPELIAEHYAEAVGESAPQGGAEEVQMLGPFRIEGLLGRGGQATVHVAQDTRLHRRVALKVFRGLRPGDAATRLRFRREAEVASQLDHPGICTVFEAGVEGGVPYIAMQLLEGENLARKISRSGSGTGPETTAVSISLSGGSGETRAETASSVGRTRFERSEILRIVELMEQTARALHVAHEAGVLHRDIKPANIMVEPDGRPVITDFGLARQEDSDLPTLTRTGELFGTPAYMSPEQLTRQAIQLDRRSDVWSLGATLYECLTMHRPFEGPTREALYQAILTREPPDPHRLNPAVSKDLKVVLETALQKDRDRRYRTALDFAEDLRRVRKSEPIRARPISIFGRTWRWARRRPARATLAAVLLLGIPLLAGLGGFILANLDDIREVDRQRIRARVERHLEDGYLLSKSDWKEAGLEFRKALDLDPENVDAIVAVAMELRPEGALALLEERPALAAANHCLRIRKARYLRQLGRTREAEDWEAAPSSPSTASDHFSLGFHRVNDQSDQALDLLLDAVLRTRHQPRLLYYAFLARAAGNAGDAWLSRVLADAVVALWPDSSFAWYARGDALSKGTKDQAGAVAAFREAVRRRPDFPPYHYILSIGLRRVRAYDEAIAAAERAIALRPGYLNGQVELIQALFERGDYERVIESHSRTLECHPDMETLYPGMRVTLARAYRELGRNEEAIAAFREAMRRIPERADIRFEFGQLVLQHGDFREAVRLMREGCDLSLEQDPRRAGDSLRRLGRAVRSWIQDLEEFDEIERAIEVLREYVGYFPEEMDRHFRRQLSRLTGGE